MSHREDSAFIRFMQVVTGRSASDASRPDPDEVRISQLEAQVRAMRRSVRRSASPRTAGPLQGTRSPGST
jgi:hypothetical protein